MRYYRLKINLPFLTEGREFAFEDDSANVYAVLDGKTAEYPLRTGLGAYLWLLLSEGDKYLEALTQ